MSKEKEQEPAVVAIRRRHEAVTERSREINETYSALLSALILPFVLEKILFSSNSPFFQIFIDYFSTHTPELLKEAAPWLDLMEGMGKVKQQLGSTLENLPPPKPFSHLLDQNLSQEQLRKLLFSATADMCRQKRCRTEADKMKVFQEVAAEYAEEAQLNALRALKKVKGNLPVDFLRENAPRLAAQMEFTNLMNAPKILGVWLGKRFIMDPLLQRSWTNGVVPLPKFLELLPPNELRAVSKQLEATEKAQQIPARRAANISMSILPIFFMLYLLQTTTGFRIPQTLWLTCFSLLISGTTHIAYATKKYYDERNYKDTLKNNTHLCGKLFNPTFTQTVSSQDFRNLRNSRISIRFKAYDELSSTQICRTIYQVLTQNGVTPVDALGDSLWLRGATFLSETKIAKIQAEITQALESKKERGLQKKRKPLDTTLWSEDVEPKVKIRNVRPQPNLNNNNNIQPAQIERPEAAPATTFTLAKNKPVSQIINTVGNSRFTLFNLSKEDFPTEASHKKFQGIITVDPKVASLLAKQGLVHSKKFGGTLKAKALGEFGNIRVYASKKEVAPTGETMYIFDRVISKAH